MAGITPVKRRGIQVWKDTCCSGQVVMRENMLKNGQKGHNDINRNQSCFFFKGK